MSMLRPQQPGVADATIDTPDLRGSHPGHVEGRSCESRDPLPNGGKVERRHRRTGNTTSYNASGSGGGMIVRPLSSSNVNRRPNGAPVGAQKRLKRPGFSGGSYL